MEYEKIPNIPEGLTKKEETFWLKGYSAGLYKGQFEKDLILKKEKLTKAKKYWK